MQSAIELLVAHGFLVGKPEIRTLSAGVSVDLQAAKEGDRNSIARHIRRQFILQAGEAILSSMTGLVRDEGSERIYEARVSVINPVRGMNPLIDALESIA